MEVYLDNIIFSLQKAGGISVYWMELIKRIIPQKGISLNFIESESANDNIFRKKLILFNHNIIKSKINNAFFSRYLPIRVKSKAPFFIFHSSYFRVCKSRNAINIATIHDCTYELYGSGLGKLINIFQKKYLLRHAEVIICISNNTKKDLLYFYPWVNAKKIKVVYQSAGNEFYPLDDPQFFDGMSEILRNRNYLIYVGSRAGYKNFDVLVEAMEQLPDYSLLVIGGGEMNSLEIAKVKNIQERLVHVKSVSSEELNLYYNYAFSLVYPSKYEGFGIPLLEAMKAGCPVISTNFSSIPEVAGDSALLMCEASANEIVESVKKLEDENARKKFIELGFSRASNFSWDRCSRETIKIYDEAITSRLAHRN